MDARAGVVKVIDSKLYVKREDGQWELFWPRSEAERLAGRGLEQRTVGPDRHDQHGTAGPAW